MPNVNSYQASDTRKTQVHEKEKMGIKGYFNIQIQTVEINLCPNF